MTGQVIRVQIHGYKYVILVEKHHETRKYAASVSIKTGQDSYSVIWESTTSYTTFASASASSMEQAADHFERAVVFGRTE
jgi:hypothetical protein